MNVSCILVSANTNVLFICNVADFSKTIYIFAVVDKLTDLALPVPVVF